MVEYWRMGLVLLHPGTDAGNNNNNNNVVTGIFFRSLKYWNCMEMLGNLLETLSMV